MIGNYFLSFLCDVRFPNDVNHPLVLYPIIGVNASNYKESWDILLIGMLRNMYSGKVCIYMMLVRCSAMASVLLVAKRYGYQGVCRCCVGWVWGEIGVEWGDENVGGREQLRAFLSVTGAFRM